MGSEITMVTGAGRGYGAVVARRLVSSGAKVAVLGRDALAIEGLAREIDGIAVVADVLDRRAVEDAFAAIAADHGPIRVLINNAGVGGPLGLAWEVDPDEWWHTLEVNVRGTHNATRAALGQMVAAGEGRIVNVVSHAGTARWPNGSAYAVSKAAVIKYGENLAAEVRKRGVTVINYHPGVLAIGLTATLLESDPPPGTADRLVADWFRDQIATGRAVDPDASADLLVRLARGDADLLTGRYLTAYDDLDELLTQIDLIKAANLYTMGLLEP